MLLSVIVPVYNVEQYLNRCLDSLIELQHLSEYEVLLIDDGGIDGCPLICKTYAERFSNFSVIRKENGGLSDARNIGLKHAVGKYIMFVDSDDYIKSGSISKILSIITNNDNDIICFGSEHFLPNGMSHLSLFTKSDPMSGINYFKYQYSKKTFPVAVWNSVYRRSFLLSNDLFFIKGIYHEDTEWTPKVYFLADSVVNICAPIYNYILRPNSICTQKDLSKNLLDLEFTISELLNNKNLLIDKLSYKMLKDLLVSSYLGVYGKNGRPDFPTGFKKSFLVKDLYFWKTRFKAFTFFISKRLFCSLFNRKNGGHTGA